MLFLAETTFTTPLDGEVRVAHRRWVTTALHEGRLLVSGVLKPEGEPLMGCIIFRAQSLDGARAFASSDPVVLEGIAQVSRVIEFEPHVRIGDLADALGNLVVIERGSAATEQ